MVECTERQPRTIQVAAQYTCFCALSSVLFVNDAVQEKASDTQKRAPQRGHDIVTGTLENKTATPNDPKVPIAE